MRFIFILLFIFFGCENLSSSNQVEDDEEDFEGCEEIDNQEECDRVEGCEWSENAGCIEGEWEDDEEGEDDEEDSSNLVEEYFAYNISNQVAFYFFNNVMINGQLIDTTDWVAAFKNDTCVGSRQWNCSSNTCEIPIYGQYSLNQETQSYMLPGELPSFKIYDSSENIYYDAIPSSQIPWQDGIYPIIDSLVVQ